MKILKAEKFEPRRRPTPSSTLPQMRKTDWEVLMQHDRVTGKLDLKSKQFIADPASVKRLLENKMITADGRLTPAAQEKCGELARKLRKPDGAASPLPGLSPEEARKRMRAKLTASDWAVLMKYDRNSGNLLKYDEETGELDTTSRAILKDPAIIQRLIDNNKILPGGWLTPEAKSECARIEEKLKARPADGYKKSEPGELETQTPSGSQTFADKLSKIYAGPEGRPMVPPKSDPELTSKGEQKTKDVPEPKPKDDRVSPTVMMRQHYPEPKAEPAFQDEPVSSEQPTDQIPENITEVEDLTGEDMQTFFEELPVDHPNPNPEAKSKGERKSSGEFLSKDEPKPKEDKKRAPETMPVKKVPIEDSASTAAARNIDWGAIARLSHQKEERLRRRGRGPDSTDGDIPEPPAISLRDIFHVVFKRRAQIVLFFAAVVLTVAIGTFLMKPTYQAKAQILVKLGRESVFIPATGKSGAVINTDREERINSEIEILKSRALAEKVVSGLGPTVLYPDLKDDGPGLLGRVFAGADPDVSFEEKMARRFETAVAIFQKALEVEGIKKSNVVQLSFKHENAQMAARVVNKLADAYLDEHVSVHKAPKNVKFFEEQSRLLQTKMENSEEKLKALKKQYNVTSLDEERTLLLQQAAALRAGLNATLSQKVEAEKRINQIHKQLGIIPKTINQGEQTNQNELLINTLEARLVELQLEEKKLLARYTDNSRPVTNVREEIKIVSQKLAEQEGKRYGRRSTGLNPTYQNLQQTLYQNEAELDAIKAKAQSQQTHLIAYQGQLDKLNQIEIELNQLQQQVDVNRENYRLYLTKFEESRISDAMDTEKITNVSLIEPARAPMKPVSPKKGLNLLLAVFLGAFGGLGLAFFMEYMDDKIEKIEDVEEILDLPVLASVPIMEASATGKRSRKSSDEKFKL